MTRAPESQHKLIGHAGQDPPIWRTLFEGSLHHATEAFKSSMFNWPIGGELLLLDPDGKRLRHFEQKPKGDTP